MSRFRKLTHAIWHCHYHIVWCPKYRFKILKGEIAKEVETCVRIFSQRLKCEIKELNIQEDHVHVLVMIPPKIPVSDFVGTVKGKTAIHMFRKFPQLRRKPYWGNHFWAEGYCVDTVGVNEDMIRKYVKYQENK